MVKIVTDGVSNIPPNIAQELDITVLTILVCFGEEAYRDCVDLGSDEFYEKKQMNQTISADGHCNPSSEPLA